MDQDERRVYLLRTLLAERQEERGTIPPSPEEQWRLLRSLFNVRPPRPVSEAFLQVQDAYLQEETARKGIVDWADLPPVEEGIALWRGDITALRVDGIVNAANSQLLGCFCPCHGCIDNAIHTYAGVQLRLACAELMARQGEEEPVGRAKITPGFNLPCRYVLHTVGPYVAGPLTEGPVSYTHLAGSASAAGSISIWRRKRPGCTCCWGSKRSCWTSTRPSASSGRRRRRPRWCPTSVSYTHLPGLQGQKPSAGQRAEGLCGVYGRPDAGHHHPRAH